MGKIVADIVVDLQYGDSGKGKVAHYLAKTGSYTHVMRYSGGANAGHTIYHEGKKFVTHMIPVGVFFGIPSIISNGCVLNVDGFLAEIEELEDAGIEARKLLKIASNTHIVTDEHLVEDGKDTKVGTTKRGIGPAYRDKHARTGIRAESIPELKEFVFDLHDFLHNSKEDLRILCEGAQGYGLGIDWGDYPYVTSSNPTVASVVLSGIPHNSIGEVWGVIKAYETYVGGQKRGKPFQPDGEVFKKIQNVGNEFGATTGRPRETNWTDSDLVTRGAQNNGITKLVVNKCDILDEVGAWGLVKNGKAVEYKTKNEFDEAILDLASNVGVDKDNVYFSGSPDKI